MKTKNDRIMLSLIYAARNVKKLKFTMEQKASRLLSRLGLRTPFNKIHL